MIRAIHVMVQCILRSPSPQPSSIDFCHLLSPTHPPFIFCILDLLAILIQTPPPTNPAPSSSSKVPLLLLLLFWLWYVRFRVDNVMEEHCKLRGASVFVSVYCPLPEALVDVELSRFVRALVAPLPHPLYSSDTDCVFALTLLPPIFTP